MAKKTRKEGTKRHKNHIAIRLVTEAETRDPPSQDPRDHIEQAIKA